MSSIIKRSIFTGAVVLAAVSGLSQAQADDYRLWREQVTAPETQRVKLPQRSVTLHPGGDYLLWREQVEAAAEPLYATHSYEASSEYLLWREQVKSASRDSRREIAARDNAPQ